MTKQNKRTEALDILHRRYYKDNPERLAELEDAFINDDIASKIHELRTEAGLSMRELADMVGTTASVICRLEDADYEGHSLSMLNRIATALNMRVKVDFVPIFPKAPQSLVSRD
jgi:ribosome-binding protein aMBF1 (putative translation factor)